MAVGPGDRIGPYSVIAAIGSGGMGEVWKARDTRLARDVAIKVLPPAFSHDPDRRARFDREARVLASLNHPNIASIYGIEEGPDQTADSVLALVMELVEGETLADRLARGPLPFDEAFAIARQIADALEAAHEKGIVHRDLKPANVKTTPSGSVKVLDFGLAKALEGESVPADITRSPTLTVDATRQGVILGTAAYMSPEQAQGRPVDHRTDVWAFGAVLYELLAGRRPFRGDTVPESLASILRDEPDWLAVRWANSPLSFRRRYVLDPIRRRQHRAAADPQSVRSIPLVHSREAAVVLRTGAPVGVHPAGRYRDLPQLRCGPRRPPRRVDARRAPSRPPAGDLHLELLCRDRAKAVRC
jgi:serine/threonine protein kinase